MLKVREATAAELGRYYNAVKIDFDSRELLPLSSIRRAVRRGDQEFLLFYEEETGLTEGYALCCIRNVYGYVLLKYFGIFSWYQGKGHGVEAMRLLHKRYADRQGILAELTVFDDSEDGEYLRKLGASSNASAMWKSPVPTGWAVRKCCSPQNRSAGRRRSNRWHGES